jgi:hypothetical protein
MLFSPFFSRLSKVLAEGKSPRRPALTAALVVLVWVLLQLILFRPYYLVNDDILKVLMAKGFGTGGVPSDFFEGSNVLLGMFFKWWFSLFPNEPWFGWFLYGLQALALWGFLWAELSRPKPWFRAVLFLAAMEGVYFLFFTYLQFNIVSILSVQSGFWLLMASFEAGEKNPKTWMALGSCSFLWIASLLRPEALGVGTLLAVPLFLADRETVLREIRRPLFRRLLFSAGALIVLCYLFHSVHSFRSPEWKQFWAFHRESDGLNEYRSAQFDPGTKPTFDQVGWSFNDLWLFKNLYWMDLEKFSVEKLRILNDKFPRWVLGGKFGAYSSWGSLLSSHWDLRILLWAFGIAFFCAPNRLWAMLTSLGMVIFILALLLYWLKATDRVTLPILTSLIVFAVRFAEFPMIRSGWSPWKVTAGFLALLVLASMTFQEVRSYRVQNLTRQGAEVRFDQSLRDLGSFKGQLIILWDFPLECANAFDDLERFRPLHIFLMSASQRSPVQAGLIKDYGLEDFGKGMVDNPRVLLNCSGEEGAHLAVYLQENKGIKVRPQKVYECEFFKVFALHSRP